MYIYSLEWYRQAHLSFKYARLILDRLKFIVTQKRHLKATRKRCLSVADRLSTCLCLLFLAERRSVLLSLRSFIISLLRLL